jgi:hypothetical protein
LEVNIGTNPLRFYLSSEPLDHQNGCSSLGPSQSWDLAPIQYDKWYDFAAHIKWATDPNIGFIEMWLVGQHVPPLTHVRTLDTSDGACLEGHLYRVPYSATNVMYQDYFRRHDAFVPLSHHLLLPQRQHLLLFSHLFA